jgi:hypothetical protein
MKTLSVRFRFVVTGVIVLVAIVSCCNFTCIRDTRISSYSVEIGRQRAPRYVEWKDPDQFKNVLNQVCANGGEYCLCVVMTAGADPIYPYHPCPRTHCPRYDCPTENIRTVKVTKSKAADNIAAGESAVNDPNATYRIQSPNPGDIIKVLDALKK